MTGGSLTLFSVCLWVYSDVIVCSNAIAGETALDRLACALGGKVVLPYVTAAVAPMMANS